MKKNNFINNARIFKGIKENEIDSLLECLGTCTKKFAKNDFIFYKGDITEDAGLIIEGSALIINEDFLGNRNIIAKIMPGELFAESFACVPNQSMTVSVQAEKECVIMFLNVKRILKVCSSACSFHNRLILNLISEIAEKNLRSNEKMAHMSRKTTRSKLISYLSAEVLKHGKTEFDIPFNRQQLADYLSVERSAMSKELCRLRDSGILYFNKNHFVLYEASEE